jgi:hypothetical protein
MSKLVEQIAEIQRRAHVCPECRGAKRIDTPLALGKKMKCWICNGKGSVDATHEESCQGPEEAKQTDACTIIQDDLEAGAPDKQAAPIAMEDLLSLAGSDGDDLPGPETIYTKSMDIRKEVAEQLGCEEVMS